MIKIENWDGAEYTLDQLMDWYGSYASMTYEICEHIMEIIITGMNKRGKWLY